VLVAVAALGVYGFWLEPSSLRLSRYDVPVPAAPNLKGLKIVVISDLHAGAPFIDAAKIDAVTAMANAAKPDLILLAGDYIGNRGPGPIPIPIETIVAHLKPLSAPLGVYAVMGNHDRWYSADSQLIYELDQAGIRVLENRHVTIATPRGPLYLVGISDNFSKLSDPVRALSGVPAGAHALCFTHSPDVFPELAPTCALTVAGHTHGGQFAMLGRFIVPSRYGDRYIAGLVRENGKVLFVSTGIGTSMLAVRLGVPPEVTFLTVR
jgi:predicted MPP superfamily phosphohydrolase